MQFLKGKGKGAGGIVLTWGVLLGVAVLVLAVMFFAKGGTLPNQTLIGDSQVAVSLSSLTSGLTLNDDDPTYQVISMDDADLNSANNTQKSFTINLDRVDNLKDEAGEGQIYHIEPVLGASGMRSYKGYTTTSTDYYTVQYDTSAAEYNTTIGGKSTTLSNKGVNIEVVQGTTATSAVTVTFDDYTTYDAELVKNSLDVSTLAAYEIIDPNGQVESTIVVKYIK